MTQARILVVEDEAITAEDLKQHLEKFGYEVPGIAYTGMDAIQKAEELKPDLILMDIVLKDKMRGTEAARIIGKKFNIPIVYLTAHGDTDTVNEAKRTSPYGFLVKPFVPRELCTTIEIALYKHLMEKKLVDEEQWLAKTLHCINDGIIACDPQGQVTTINAAAERLIGRQCEEIVGKPLDSLLQLFDSTERPLTEALKSALNEKHLFCFPTNTMCLSRTGEKRPVEGGASPVFDRNNQLIQSVVILRDLSERRRVEQQLKESENRFNTAFNNASIGMAFVSLEGTILQVNNTFCSLLACSNKEILNQNLSLITPQEEWSTEKNFFRHLISNDLASIHMEKRFYNKHHEIVWTLLNASLVRDVDGSSLYLLYQIQDISERKRWERQMETVANYDLLTGLPNRSLFEGTLKQTMLTAQCAKSRFALFLLDLDNFKLINENLGYSPGDLLLKAVAKRLKTLFVADESVTRISSDEFVVLVPTIPHLEKVVSTAQKIMELFTEPFLIEEKQFFLTTSVGISIFPHDGENGEELLRNADIALNNAKKEGANQYQFAKPELTAEAHNILATENALRTALTKGEFEVFYQPIIDAKSGKICSAEALLRWNREGKIITPDQFITVAEQTGLIVPIGEWVMKQACAQPDSWHRSGLNSLSIAVNISVRQFRDIHLLIKIEQIIKDSGIDPKQIHIEITESLFLLKKKLFIDIVRKLLALGIQVGIDDFGTGYSSFSLLRAFKVDFFKIDISFIQDLGKDPQAKVIVAGIISMAKALGATTIAEGVETKEQYEILEELGCDQLQGFYFSHPLPEAELTALLKQQYAQVRS